MAGITVDHLTKSFAGHTVVPDFSLEVAQGEFMTFLGPSGCGKTTVLRMLAGFEQPDSGRIHFNGQEVTHLPTRLRNVGMVFQQYALFPNMTVEQNIAFGLTVKKRDSQFIQRRVGEMLELVQLQRFGKRYPAQLSGGQQQRVALARAIAMEPQVLLLDEPLSALDAHTRVSLRDEIRALQQRLGMTTVFVTHDQEEAMAVSDRIAVLQAGRIEQIGSPATLYNQPQTRFVANFLGRMNLLSAQRVAGQEGHFAVSGSGDHVLQATSTASSPNTTTVDLGIRPEAVRLHSQDPSDTGLSNNLPVRVRSTQMLGALLRVQLDWQHSTPHSTDEAALVVDLLNQADTLALDVGQTLWAHLPVSALRVLA
ncbi:ABC transporter ATP-binding protein [Curvibacter sp. CHRR-16]|uniref:ABC transporter ATP-binding protein n=1 Tax=Curvibacter sp. CHRR-16 TaxID=2835872 RepID=UPI001BDA7204|nr:ABC transporter ATP-binding protein [Curvibacter sp. CHRR-16]MBT0570446.1 ABC transporter ATP-binding protein [Curvibacter sp. CHRR-16]